MDRKTRRRQAAALAVALLSLVFTLMLDIRGGAWLIPALASYALLGLIVYHGNRRVIFVPHEPD